MNNFYAKRFPISQNILMVLLFLSITAFSTSVKAEDLTVYSTFGTLADAHNEKQDYGIGHGRLRESDLSFTENGDVIGHAHSISFVKKHDKKTNLNTREYLGLIRLPEGTFWLKDVVKVPHKVVTAPQGYKLSGDIIGGTQGYEGIKGTFESQMAADGKAFVSVYHIVRPN
jgi:hypothetical protein